MCAPLRAAGPLAFRRGTPHRRAGDRLDVDRRRITWATRSCSWRIADANRDRSAGSLTPTPAGARHSAAARDGGRLRSRC